MEQRAYDLLLVGVLFTNKLMEQRAYDLRLVGVLTPCWCSFHQQATPCWCSFHQQADGAAFYFIKIAA
jgi:hypothetical protein